MLSYNTFTRTYLCTIITLLPLICLINSFIIHFLGMYSNSKDQYQQTLVIDGAVWRSDFTGTTLRGLYCEKAESQEHSHWRSKKVEKDTQHNRWIMSGNTLPPRMFGVGCFWLHKLVILKNSFFGTHVFWWSRWVSQITWNGGSTKKHEVFGSIKTHEVFGGDEH